MAVRKKAASKKEAYKWPKTPGACADYGYKLRQRRSELNAQAAKLEKEEKALKKHMFSLLGRSKQTGIKGRVGQFNMVPKDIPTVEDFSKVLKFAAKTIKGDMPYSGLLQHRLNNTMVSNMWADGKDVPGVGSIEVLTGNFNKV